MAGLEDEDKRVFTEEVVEQGSKKARRGGGDCAGI